MFAPESLTPCCTRLNLTAVAQHGLQLIHWNKLGSFTITTTLVRGRATWVSDTDPEFVISWCGKFWHIGHRGEAGECAGYIRNNSVITLAS